MKYYTDRMFSNPLLMVLLCILSLFPLQSAAALDVQAHRGGRDLWPENTMAAFRNAIELGVTSLELDLAMTKDLEVVISHEPALTSRLVKDSCGRYVSDHPAVYIKDLTFDELSTYTVGELNPSTSYYRSHSTQKPVEGERIPKLSTLFSYVDELGLDGLRFNIEIKTYPENPEYTHDPELFVEKVVEIIRQFGKEDVTTVQSFDWRTLSMVKKIAPELSIACITASKLRLGGRTFNLRPHEWGASPWLDGFDVDDYSSVPDLVYAFGADVISPYYRETSFSDVRRAHELGLLITPWTVNDPSVMKRLISWGVDGIITDRPDILLQVLGDQQ